MSRLSELGGKRLPFLRWSMVRMLIGMRRLTRDWQVGDGRELALAQYVEAEAREGDLDDVIRVVDDFAYHRSFLINVGDEKGEILDAAIRRTEPRQLLELGTYCGYSALRTARVMPEGARLVRSSSTPTTRRSHGGSGTTPARRGADGARRNARRRRARRSRGSSPSTASRRIAGLRLRRPRQVRLPARPRADPRPGLAASRLAWSSPTTSGGPERPTTASTCEPRRAGAGGPPSTKPTSSTSRSSRTWCSSPSTWELTRQRCEFG